MKKYLFLSFTIICMILFVVFFVFLIEKLEEVKWTIAILLTTAGLCALIGCYQLGRHQQMFEPVSWSDIPYRFYFQVEKEIGIIYDDKTKERPILYYYTVIARPEKGTRAERYTISSPVQLILDKMYYKSFAGVPEKLLTAA